MEFTNSNWSNALKTAAASRRCGNSATGVVTGVIIGTILLGACDVYDSELITEQDDETNEPPLSSLPNLTGEEGAIASVGQYSAQTDDEEVASFASHKLDPSCIPNPNGGEFCPWICDEVCDNWDNDCDGETDESEADASCELTNAVAECSQGVCAIKSCAKGFDNCDDEDDNGCETPLNTLSDCGSCDNECVEVSCDNGSCSELECEDEDADCDGEPENGCETPLGTNTDCGFCGDECPELPDDDFPHAATAGCFEGECRISQCEQGYRDCNNIYNDGCEIRVSDDEDNCGECGLSCRALPNVREATCQEGVCVVDTCQADYQDSNNTPSDGCEARSENPVSPEAGCVLKSHAEHIYYFCSAMKTWSEAHNSCTQAGLYLVRIDDAAENNFIYSNITQDHWIGASDSWTEGVWVWTVDGQPFWISNPGYPNTGGAQHPGAQGLFVNWAPQEPDDGNNSDCGRITASDNGGWRDKECFNLFSYVCEGNSDSAPCTNPGFCETANGAIRGADGVCKYPANLGDSCDDHDPCTHTDRCQADKSCAGTRYACDNPGFCETTQGATCNGNGTCVYQTAQNGRCDDDDPCTHTDRCQADRTCLGTTYTCDNPGFCETANGAICNGNGTCTYPANVGAACDDGNQCTNGDRCLADRSCGGVINTGAACDDGNACSENDVCDESGVCGRSDVESCDDNDDQDDNDDDQGENEQQ